MEQYFKARIKVAYEDKKGNEKWRGEVYIVSGVNPTDVETKIHKHLTMSDFEIVSISVTKIIDIIK